MFYIDDDESLLRFGTLELTGEGDWFRLRTWTYGDELDLGAPEALTQTMQSFLQDGAVVATTGHGNRTLPLTVTIIADDGEGLSLGEAALIEQCRATWDGRIVPLRWTPPAGMGPVCVFEVVAAELAAAPIMKAVELEPDKVGASYTLTLECGPWAAADGVVTQTIPAPTSSTPVTPTVVEIDACDSTTGWAASSASTLSTGSDSGDTYVMASSANSGAVISLTRSGLAVSMAATPYLVVRMGASVDTGNGRPLPLTPTVKVNGTVLAPVSQSGYTYWYSFAGTVNSVQLSIDPGAFGTPKSAFLRVWDVSRTDMISAVTLTQLQVSRQFEVQGSVRTPASISVRGVKVSDQSDAPLGQTIVYTTRSQGVAVPSLRAVRIDGGADTADATAYSGKKSALSTTHRFQQPVTALASAGYQLAARVQAATTGVATLTWTAKTVMGGSTVSAVQTGTVSVNVTAANAWQVATVGLPVLSPALAGSAGLVEISLFSPTLTLDEAWLCDMDHGQLTDLDAGASTRLWLDAATFETPVNLVWVGTQADRSDSYVPGAVVRAAEQHEVAPPVVSIFVASANPAEITLAYTPRGHTRAPAIKAVA